MKKGDSEQRLARCEELRIALRKTPGETVAILTREFGVTSRTVYNDMRKMNARIREATAAERPTRMAQLRTYLWGIADKCGAEGERSTQVAACRELAKIGGLYAPTRIDQTGVMATVTVDDLRAMPAAARAHLRAWAETMREAGAATELDQESDE